MLYLVVFFSRMFDIYVCYMINKITYLLTYGGFTQTAIFQKCKSERIILKPFTAAHTPGGMFLKTLTGITATINKKLPVMRVCAGQLIEQIMI